MKLYEIYLVGPEGDTFTIGHHSGTRGETALKARYAAKRLGAQVVLDADAGDAYPLNPEWGWNSTRVEFQVVGPAEWEDVYAYRRGDECAD